MYLFSQDSGASADQCLYALKHTVGKPVYGQPSQPSNLQGRRQGNPRRKQAARWDQCMQSSHVILPDIEPIFADIKVEVGEFNHNKALEGLHLKKIAPHKSVK